MSYDFQVVDIDMSCKTVKISHSGSNCYTSITELWDDDYKGEMFIYARTQECVIIHVTASANEYKSDSTYAFFREYSPSKKSRWISSQQAIDAGAHIDRVLKNGGDLTADCLEHGPLPDKLLRLLIELNVCEATDEWLSAERIEEIFF